MGGDLWDFYISLNRSRNSGNQASEFLYSSLSKKRYMVLTYSPICVQAGNKENQRLGQGGKKAPILKLPQSGR